MPVGLNCRGLVGEPVSDSRIEVGVGERRCDYQVAQTLTPVGNVFTVPFSYLKKNVLYEYVPLHWHPRWAVRLLNITIPTSMGCESRPCDIPVADILIEGTGGDEHTAHGRNFCGIPFLTDIRIEHVGIVEHRRHVLNLGGIPVANGLIESTTSEKMAHVGNLPKYSRQPDWFVEGPRVAPLNIPDIEVTLEVSQLPISPIEGGTWRL